mmetsp:Transcript_106176/g.295652  ORF Transcript_106176/g.295652 Transcript_106176/m.295652 type:complete len:95 (-) Transcript_106176:838-1122(-)
MNLVKKLWLAPDDGRASVLKKMEFVLVFMGINSFPSVRKTSPKLCQLVGHLNNRRDLYGPGPVCIVVAKVPCQLRKRHLLHFLVVVNHDVTDRL